MQLSTICIKHTEMGLKQYCTSISFLCMGTDNAQAILSTVVWFLVEHSSLSRPLLECLRHDLALACKLRSMQESRTSELLRNRSCSGPPSRQFHVQDGMQICKDHSPLAVVHWVKHSSSFKSWIPQTICHAQASQAVRICWWPWPRAWAIVQAQLLCLCTNLFL